MAFFQEFYKQEIPTGFCRSPDWEFPELRKSYPVCALPVIANSLPCCGADELRRRYLVCNQSIISKGELRQEFTVCNPARVDTQLRYEFPVCDY